MSKDNADLEADSEEDMDETAAAEETAIVEASEAKQEPEKEKAAPRKEEAAPEGEVTEESEKKAKPKKEEKGEEEEEKVLEEKIITLNLRHAHLAYSRKPTPRSVRLVKKAAGRIFKSDTVKIDQRVNAILWARGKTKAERRVAVKVQKLEGGTVRVLPATE